jgi:hypothetical protein
MKKLIVLLAVVIAVSAILAAASPASAAQGKDTWRYKNGYGYVYGSQWDWDTYTYSYVSLSANETVYNYNSDRWEDGYVSIYYYLSAPDAYTYVSGYVYNGQFALATNGLASVTASADDMPVWYSSWHLDPISGWTGSYGETTADAAFDLAGVGETSGGNNVYHSFSPGYNYVSRGNGQSREAELQSYTFDVAGLGSIDLSSFDYLYATLGQSRSGTMSVWHY